MRFLKLFSKNDIVQTIALTSDEHMKQFSKVVHHSYQHIEWNSGDFLTDSLL